MNAATDRPLLEIERLEVQFDTRRGVVRGLRVYSAGVAFVAATTVGRGSAGTVVIRAGALARERAGGTFRNGRYASRGPLTYLRADPMERYYACYCGDHGSCLLLPE